MTKYIDKECPHHGLTRFVLEGRGYYRCRKCRAEHVDRVRKKTKLKAIEHMGGKCNTCGYDRNIAALEFHHISGDKEFNISGNGNTLKWDKILVELEKCVLLCANCHREEHNPELNKGC